jgi:hypothetical protein
MARRRIYGVAAAAAAGAVLVATPSSAMTAPELQTPDTAKSDYDIQNYKLALGYDSPDREVNATTTITATAKSPTRTFTLDFDRVPKAATVNGVPATVTTKDGQTVITLGKTLPEGQQLTIVLTYTVTPPTTQDGAGFPAIKAPAGETDLSDAGLPTGWLPRNVKPDAATLNLVSALPANLTAWKTALGMRYLEKVATEHESKPASDLTTDKAEREAAARAAFAQRAAEWKAKRAAAEADRDEQRERWEARRAEWKRDHAERAESRRHDGERGGEHRGRHHHGHGNHGDHGNHRGGR